MLEGAVCTMCAPGDQEKSYQANINRGVEASGVRRSRRHLRLDAFDACGRDCSTRGLDPTGARGLAQDKDQDHEGLKRFLRAGRAPKDFARVAHQRRLSEV